MTYDNAMTRKKHIKRVESNDLIQPILYFVKDEIISPFSLYVRIDQKTI
jgi:hypothetical protein